MFGGAHTGRHCNGTKGTMQLPIATEGEGRRGQLRASAEGMAEGPVSADAERAIPARRAAAVHSDNRYDTRGVGMTRSCARAGRPRLRHELTPYGLRPDAVEQRVGASRGNAVCLRSWGVIVCFLDGFCLGNIGHGNYAAPVELWKENSMGTKVGLWIDHRKAIVVAVTDKGEERGVARIGCIS